MKPRPDEPRTAELPHLETFIMAAEEGSFTAAASLLSISQAAVSQRIAVLERELRVSLFQRGAGRIALTDAGQRLHEYSRQILELHKHARTELGNFPPSISGGLAIAASSVPGECFLPALLAAFRVQYPQVRVRATVGDSVSVIKDVEKGIAVLGLIGQQSETRTLEARAI